MQALRTSALVAGTQHPCTLLICSLMLLPELLQPTFLSRLCRFSFFSFFSLFSFLSFLCRFSLRSL